MASAKRSSRVAVFSRSASAQSGRIVAGNVSAPCALGRAGVRRDKREGDGATPAGCFRILRGLYRPDRLMRPKSALPFTPIRARDGWCDAPGDRNYNRRVVLPYPASHERLWRKDGLYDVVVILDYNVTRRRRMRGSAIFMHVARRGLKPTAGCVALALPDMQRVLRALRPGARLVVGGCVQRGRRGLR
ncbi:MAG: L,D-transpeptidase family protein [Hyphomicrobiales bacterium]|nr:L,D-transpeptidase family protein [Hyphomicrobiales bacterium]